MVWFLPDIVGELSAQPTPVPATSRPPAPDHMSTRHNGARVPPAQHQIKDVPDEVHATFAFERPPPGRASRSTFSLSSSKKQVRLLSTRCSTAPRTSGRPNRRGSRRRSGAGRSRRAELIAVDASVVVVALCDDGPDGDRARRRLRDERMAAPHLLDLEVTSAWRRLASAGHVDNRRATARHRRSASVVPRADTTPTVAGTVLGTPGQPDHIRRRLGSPGRDLRSEACHR